MDKPQHKAWSQELVWVQRNQNNVIIGVRETPPKTGDIIPIVPRKKVHVIGD